MANSIRKFLKRGRFAVAGALFVLSIATAGAATLSTPTIAKADACDPVNIVYCGLDSRSLGSAINSFQADYNNGSNNGHHDLKTVYRWAGATDANVANMNTSNTKLGTMYRNGDIKVNGTVVGHDAWVSARFGAGQNGFVKVANTDGVYARKTTTSLAENTAPIIVHFDTNGNANYAIMVGCGNAVMFTTTPQRHPALSCDNLAKDKIADRKFQFSASASANDTTITKYVFDYGDGSSDKVATNNKQASVTHAFDKYDHDYTVRVTVFSDDFQDGKSGANCVTTVHTSPQQTQPQPPALVCTLLSATNNGLDYTFYAQAKPSNGATIKSYTYTFSDGSAPVTLSSNNVQLSILKHTFAQNGAAETVYVTVKGSDGLSTQPSAPCTLHFSTPPVNQCKPGVPMGSPECTQCQEGSILNACQPPTIVTTTTPPTTPLTPTIPAKLANTGPAGIFGLFSGVSGLGGLVHRLLTRRKFVYLG